MDEDNNSNSANWHWTDKSDPDETYKVTITLTSKGKSSQAILETLHSKGVDLGDVSLMSDISYGKIEKIDTYPFATLLHLDQAMNFLDIARENNLPLSNYDPSEYPAAFVLASQIMNHVQDVLEKSSNQYLD